MNNEPVAWMRSDWSRVSLYEGDLCTIPLYTHPHPDNLGLAESIIKQQQAEIANLKAGLLSHHDIYPVKELTDEEIDSIWTEMSEQCDEEFIDMKQFARAILRKAQEK